MHSSALKLLAQKAKKRLSTAGQNISEKNTEKSTLAYLSPSSYAVVASKQRIEEDPLYDKVKKLLEKGDIINPLGELTDDAVFNSLSKEDKERYIMSISKRYNELKDYFIKQNV